MTFHSEVDTAASRLHAQLVNDELADLLDDAGCLDLLREYAQVTQIVDPRDDDRDVMGTLRSALLGAIEYEIGIRRGTLDAVPEWVRLTEAAE